MSPAVTAATSADLYAVAMDPWDPRHILVTFHSGWNGSADAGIAESTDSANSWILHPPKPGWDHGHYAFFLGHDDPDANGAVRPSTAAWILATQGNGYWRTMDSGRTWSQVITNYNMQHGACGLYRASNGALYMGAVSTLLRSIDNGRTWADANAPHNQDGYNAVIGDGARMFVQTANTGTATIRPNPFYTSLETDGSMRLDQDTGGTSWTPYDDELFDDGPGWMAVDRNAKVIYAALWDHGLWRLATGN
jgi:hypothetical protein